MLEKFDQKSYGCVQIEDATARSIARGAWRIIDPRPGVYEQAVLAGYRMIQTPGGGTYAPYTHVQLGPKPEAVPPPPVEDERHRRTYSCVAMREYIEAEITRELAKHESEMRARTLREKRMADWRYTRRYPTDRTYMETRRALAKQGGS